MKRLVLCFDGTWNRADGGGSPTNVARIAQAVMPRGRDGTVQLTLYLRGVGATAGGMERLIAGATGQGIDDNIRAGYLFLAQNYVAGDEVYVFGFSRGAFTARSLVGFIGACGLLRRNCQDRIMQAWERYRQGGGHVPGRCHGPVPIAFLGVWDTVGALGIPSDLLGPLVAEDYQFHDTRPSPLVRVARHALAIDEHRDEFVPTFWTGEAPAGCDIRQVWFAGAHADVGGGYRHRRLADIPLRWMAEEAALAGLGLDGGLLELPVDPLAPQHESRQSWSRKDLLTPTLRQVAGRPVPVGLLERLYRPLDRTGRPLPTIGEELHPSVRLRFGRQVRRILDDDDIDGKPHSYQPRNVAPLIG
ncbi:DUF2235 domain-containing protein [Geminicoccus harenae]|uniref:DUF2235 domain-containing protein n=1 Tax=Geminicoccus harenae TaxID=2498453 RepID=UPI00168B043A|nr:DUF2235 domain-containing protein [Geminicoccus harenae]